MSLIISRLKIVAKTADGDYGVDIPFEQGLFILRLDNTHGKSTCINAIAFALGMEKSLGLGSSKLPFPPSLTKELESADGEAHSIIKSKVFLEIKNSQGRVSTLERQIVGSGEDNIIFQYESKFDVREQVAKSKLFLHREGDSTRPLGFFKWLEQFVGWNLPLVPNYDGKEVPLYPATFFPTWFVEQKKGWSSIQATTPIFLKIREVKKRALEFILNLDVNETVKKRAKLKLDINSATQNWKLLHKKAELLAARVSGQIKGVPEVPEAKFDPYKVDVSIRKNDSWLSIQDIAEKAEAELENWHKDNAPTPVENVDTQLQAEIEKNEEELKELDVKYMKLDSDLSFLNQQVYSTKTRIANLIEDQRKYEDLRKVGEYEVYAGTSIANGNCPTCGQEFSENLLDTHSKSDVMSIDESLKFIKEQIKAFRSVVDGYNSQKKHKTVELKTVKGEMSNTRTSLRKLRESIILPNLAIKEEVLRHKINLENTVESYKNVIASIVDLRLELDGLHRNYFQLIKKRKGMPENALSPSDSKKLKSLELSLRKLLGEYGFSSFSADKLDISRETYLPTREGFDIGFDTSASDGIRIIWSYLLSLFKVSRELDTNHPQLVIFDEPRQQEANKVSFTSLLKSAAELSAGGGQIILATSEEKVAIEISLEGSSYNMVSFDKLDGKIIRKSPSLV